MAETRDIEPTEESIYPHQNISLTPNKAVARSLFTYTSERLVLHVSISIQERARFAQHNLKKTKMNPG